jgi:hypothetical protein
MIWEKWLNLIRDKYRNFTGEDKKRMVYIGTGAFVVILTLSVIFSLNTPTNKPERIKEPERTAVRIVIPVDEIFLPDEPDFVPGVLLEREKRLVWTEEDAENYWQDPLKYGEEQWRDKLEAAIDEFLERVP